MGNHDLTTYEIFSLIFSLITVLSLVFVVLQIRINRQQLYLSTISKCIDDFRRLEDLTRSTADKSLVRKYVDLVNEELFYFQHNYIPNDVAREWIDGMIDYMPIKDVKGIILNEEYCLRELAINGEEYLTNYPRVEYVFIVRKSYDFALAYSKDKGNRQSRVRLRNKLITEILENLKRLFAETKSL
jgi:hypothetical protein